MTTTGTMHSEVGQIAAVEVENAGGNTLGEHAAGVTLLQLDDASDFPPLGGQARVGDIVVDYSAADEDTDTLTLTAPSPVALEEGERVYVHPSAPTTWAQVIVDPEEGALLVEVPFGIKAFTGLEPGDLVRFTENDQGALSVVEVVGGSPSLHASYVDDAEELLLANRQMLGEKLAENDLALDAARGRLSETESRLNDAFSEIDLKPDSAYVDAVRQQAIAAAEVDAQAKADAARNAAVQTAQQALTSAEEELQQAIAAGDAAAIADAAQQVATAKAEAIDAAALTAQQKADQARLDAIEAAALDSTTKAAEVMAKATAALTAAEAAQATADNAIRTYYGPTRPWADGSDQPDDVLGDMWYDDNTGQAYRWNGTTWTVIVDQTIGQALAAAQSAQTTADGKINAFYQDTEPMEADEGDLWFDTNDSNKPYHRQAGVWVSIADERIAQQAGQLTSIQQEMTGLEGTLDGKSVVWVQATAPSGMGADDKGDIWINDGASPRVTKVWNGTAWVEADSRTAGVVADVAKKITTYYTTTPNGPTAPPGGFTIGDLWVDSHQTLRRWSGSWVMVSDPLPKVTGDSQMRVYHNPVSFRRAGNGLAGSLVINTPITPSQKMSKIIFSGYNYLNNETEIGGEVGFYAYTSDRPIINHSATSTGSAPVTIRLGLSSAGTVTIILDHAEGWWRYPSMVVVRAEIMTGPPGWSEGWSIDIVPDLDAAGYTEIVDPGTRDMSSKEDAAALAETARVAAEAAAAADATAKAEAAEAAAAATAAADATAKANQAKTDAEAAAATYADQVASGASDGALAAAKTYAEEKAEAARVAAEAAAALDATAKKESAEATAAADASAKADAARDAAIAAAAADATEKADDAKAFATTRTDGLAKTLWSTALPGTTTAPQDSVWYRTDSSGKIIAVFTQTAAGPAGNSWSARPITSEAIDNLDVGKLTSASGVINDLVAQTFAAKLANIIEANIGNLTVTGDAHLEDLVAQTIAGDTASFMSLTVDQILAGFLQAQWIITESGSIIAGDPEGARVEITSDGIRVFVLGYNGVPYEAVSMVNGEVAFAVVDQTRGMLGGISAEGDVTGQRASFAKGATIQGTDVLGTLGGSAAPGWMDLLPRGILPGRGASTTTTAYRSAGTEAVYLRCKATLHPNRLYRVVGNMEIQCGENTGVPRQRIRMATGGGPASIGSELLETHTGGPGYTSTVTQSTRVEDIIAVTVATKVEVVSTYLGLNGSTARAVSGDLYIEDVGARGIDPGSGEDEMPRTLYTTAWKATASRGYAKSGVSIPAKENKIDLWYFYPEADATGVLFGGTAYTWDDASEEGRTIPQAMNGATIHRVQLQITNAVWWNPEVTNTAINTLSSSTLPTSKVIEGYTLVKNMPEGSTLRIDLDPAWFTNGTNQGITIGDKDGSLAGELMGAGKFQGPADPDAPQLIFTYSR